MFYQQVKIRDTFKVVNGFGFAMVFNGGGANTGGPRVLPAVLCPARTR